ncbi:MAG: META domain-containing protein [marine benthic group bacterium]|jgi:heat shock protein HslJ|nr:META domain-containing protein [Gemmatimonadota bacterium]
MKAVRRGAVRHIARLALLAAGTVVSACAATQEDAPDPETDESPAAESTEATDVSAIETSVVDGTQFAGTSWMLTELQSMDDVIGTTRPEDPSRFTLTLNDDSTAAIRLDCNRATGTWSAEPSADPSNGRFEFGPLATIRARCAPPNLDEQVAADLAWVRGYLLRDGRLYLSLMADGGILAWQPYTEHDLRTEPDEKLEAAIREAAPSYTREIVGDAAGNQRARYVHGGVDLNGDGKDEVFAYMLGPFFCGTGGCSLFLFRDVGDRYELIDDFPISRTPIIVAPRESKGWHDLIRRESGGGVPASWVHHSFDGTRYVEVERTPADDGPPEGIPVLTGELSFEKGIPLEPGGTSG